MRALALGGVVVVLAASVGCTTNSCWDAACEKQEPLRVDVYDARVTDFAEVDPLEGGESLEGLLIADSDQVAIQYTDEEGRTWRVTYAISGP